MQTQLPKTKSPTSCHIIYSIIQVVVMGRALWALPEGMIDKSFCLPTPPRKQCLHLVCTARKNWNWVDLHSGWGICNIHLLFMALLLMSANYFLYKHLQILVLCKNIIYNLPYISASIPKRLTKCSLQQMQKSMNENEYPHSARNVLDQFWFSTEQK